jgi:hypothetical protein
MPCSRGINEATDGEGILSSQLAVVELDLLQATIRSRVRPRDEIFSVPSQISRSQRDTSQAGKRGYFPFLIASSARVRERRSIKGFHIALGVSDGEASPPSVM